MAMGEKAIKVHFRQYIGQYTTQNMHFEYGYPHSNAQHLSKWDIVHGPNVTDTSFFQ